MTEYLRNTLSKIFYSKNTAITPIHGKMVETRGLNRQPKDDFLEKFFEKQIEFEVCQKALSNRQKLVKERLKNPKNCTF